MLRRVLVANRGGIAVRVIRACRVLGIESVALYEPSERGALHTRLASHAAPLDSRAAYLDPERIVALARESGADAVHPGYGFLAESPALARACEAAGIVFVGPPADALARQSDKLGTLRAVRAAGFATPEFSPVSYGEEDLGALVTEAERIGFPLVIKSAAGGRGRGARLVRSRDALDSAARAAHDEARLVFGDPRVYLEKAIPGARQLGVQVLADRDGRMVHLGERNGSLQRGNQKLIDEAPSPALDDARRAALLERALEIARLMGCRNAATIEFAEDAAGRLLFTEIKPRIQGEHPVTEMVTGIDLVSRQLRIAAGEPLGLTQDDVRTRGWSIQCRISTEDPLTHVPAVGRVEQVRLPGGFGVRVDTYLFGGCDVPAEYDPAVARVCVVGEDRRECLARMKGALGELMVIGTPTNTVLHLGLLESPAFAAGTYRTDSFQAEELPPPGDPARRGDLAVAAALAWTTRQSAFRPASNDRHRTGWHRDSRRLPGGGS